MYKRSFSRKHVQSIEKESGLKVRWWIWALVVACVLWSAWGQAEQRKDYRNALQSHLEASGEIIK